ncbi:MAG TPA: hypothetical protein VHE30_14010, partial [Polyangiaceae bacterium]|nr:hypothetical protein [Polyangiaceae bacterium]
GTGGSANGADGGTGGASGSSAGGTAGTGTDAGGPPTRGAISLHVAPGTGCSLANTFEDFPKLASGHPVSATAKGEAVVDGGTTDEGPVSVRCDWWGDPTPMFDAVLKIGTAGAQRFVNLGASMDPNKTIDGGLVFSDDALPASYGSTAEGPCHYDVISMDATTRSVWGSVRCDTFSTSDGSDTCILAYSYFYFENCKIKTMP